MKTFSVTVRILVMLAVVEALHMSPPSQASTSRSPNIKNNKQNDVISTATTAFCSTVTAAVLLWGTTPVVAAATVDDTTTTAVQIQVNIPALLDAVQTKQARQSTAAKAQFVADVLQQNIGPYIHVQPPSNIRGFVQKALRGQATAYVSPILNRDGKDEAPVSTTATPVSTTVQVIGSDPGAITVLIQNPLLPKLPFVGLPQTPPLVNTIVSPLVEKAAEPTLEFLQRQQQRQVQQLEQQWPIEFWTTPTEIVVAGRALSRLDILGGASLTLGAAYGGSYGFYVYEQERQAQEAAEKKAAVAVKKKQSKKTPKPVVATSLTKEKQPSIEDTTNPKSSSSSQGDKTDSTANSTISTNEVVQSKSQTETKVEIKVEPPATKEIVTEQKSDEVVVKKVAGTTDNSTTEYPLAITIKAITDKKSSEDTEDDPPPTPKVVATQKIQLQRSNPDISTETVLKTQRSGGIRGFFQRLFGRKKKN